MYPWSSVSLVRSQLRPLLSLSLFSGKLVDLKKYVFGKSDKPTTILQKCLSILTYLILPMSLLNCVDYTLGEEGERER